MRINHNIASLNTYRQLSSNGVNTQKSLEKLSSGLRINKAGDDAAGLAISEKMRGQIRGLDQAARNSQDGISLIQTAEGALNETHSILQRMRELGVQAGTDVATDDDRQKIQSEINQLAKEVTRISNTTEFNKSNLLAGGFSDKSIQIGANGGQNIAFSIGAMDAKTLGITSDVITASAGTNNAGITGVNVRDDAPISAVAGQSVSITSSVHATDTKGAVKGLSSASALNVAEGATVTGTEDLATYAATDADPASITANGAMRTAATLETGSIAVGGLQGIATAAGATANVITFTTELNGGGPKTFTISFGTDADDEFKATSTIGDFTTLLQNKLTGALGEGVSVSQSGGVFTFTTDKAGSDASFTLTASASTGVFKMDAGNGATITDGHGMGATDGKGYGKLALNIDGKDVTVDITADSTNEDVAIAINNAANAALNTTGKTYASIGTGPNAGKLILTSQSEGSTSSVKVLGSYKADGITAGTLHQELGLTANYTTNTGIQNVGTNGTAGKISFNVNGQAFDVEITGGMSATDVRDAINSKSTTAVGANIATINTDGELELTTDVTLTTGDKTGHNANISVVGDNNGGRTLTALGLSVGTTYGKDVAAGIINLEIDGKAVNVNLTDTDDIDTVDNIINKINEDINAQLGTSATYAAKDANGKISITSQSSGSKSNVAVIGDNTNGDTIKKLGLQVENKKGANTGELSYTATLGSKTETVTVKSGADIVVFEKDFKGMTLNKDKDVNTAGSATISSSKAESTTATFTADGRTDVEASVQSGLLVDTVEAANSAVTKIDNAITVVSNQRSNLGALQNRLEHTIANLGTSSENLTAAESRIRDVDMAKEMMEFTKNNILSQAAQAMLAQANQQPQGVLQLLR